jgi:cytochrome c nitrite reductase small subunit
MMLSKKMLALFAALAGAMVGLGGFTFHYAEGLSYLSNDPKACKNCHIMNEQFESWQKGPHHSVATCNDCHVPSGFFSKYLAKAENGYHHSKGFTLQDFHEPILIKEKSSRVLQENCLRCHKDFVHEIVQGSSWGEQAVRCAHCHRDVGHGAMK